jgi:hypothetical protein
MNCIVYIYTIQFIYLFFYSFRKRNREVKCRWFGTQTPKASGKLKATSLPAPPPHLSNGDDKKWQKKLLNNAKDVEQKCILRELVKRWVYGVKCPHL